MAGEKSNETGRFEVKADAPTHFAWLRTRMSMERTLMSWVRTATALIGFGFTIFQFLYRFNKTPGVEAPEFPWAPWFLGLGLIGTGLRCADYLRLGIPVAGSLSMGARLQTCSRS